MAHLCNPGGIGDLFIAASSWVLVHGMGGQFGFFEDVSIFIHGAYPQIDAGYCTDAPRGAACHQSLLSHRDLEFSVFFLWALPLGQPLPDSLEASKSLNTIFSVFTVENWAAAPAASLLGQPWLYYGVNSFVILVLVIGGFISLSLANAIFVDEMASDNNDDVTQLLLLKGQSGHADQLAVLLFTLKSSKP